MRVFALERLPRILDRIDASASPGELAQEVAASLYETLPCVGVEVLSGEGRDAGVLFAATREGAAAARAHAEARNGDLVLRIAFAHDTQAKGYAPLVESAARLLSLGRRTTEAPPSARHQAPPPLPRPATVVPRMRALYEDAMRVGRAIEDIELPPGASIGAVVRGDKVFVAHDDVVVEPDDHVILFLVDKRQVAAVERLFQVGITFF